MKTGCFRAWVVALVCAVLCAGCAQYQVASNKEPGFAKEIDRLYVWSAIAQAPQLGSKHWTQSDSFGNYFHLILKQELTASAVQSEVREFIPAAESQQSLARFETEFSPSFRLLVTPVKTQTMTYNGATALTLLVLDLSLIEIASERRVWRAQLAVDNPLAGRLAWGEDGARSLAGKVMEALRKDGLLIRSVASTRAHIDR